MGNDKEATPTTSESGRKDDVTIWRPKYPKSPEDEAVEALLKTALLKKAREERITMTDGPAEVLTLSSDDKPPAPFDRRKQVTLLEFNPVNSENPGRSRIQLKIRNVTDTPEQAMEKLEETLYTLGIPKNVCNIRTLESGLMKGAMGLTATDFSVSMPSFVLAQNLDVSKQFEQLEAKAGSKGKQR